MHCTAIVSKETEQSHDEESSLQSSLSYRAFGDRAGTREQFIRRQAYVCTRSASPSRGRMQPTTGRQMQHTEQVPLLRSVNMKNPLAIEASGPINPESNSILVGTLRSIPPPPLPGPLLIANGLVRKHPATVPAQQSRQGATSGGRES